MIQRKKPDVDIILDVLEACLAAYQHSTFIQSLHRQYLERGGLSKKQLQGLHAKASKLESIPAGRLATLEAQILKMPNRYKSEAPPPTPLYAKDEKTGKLIDEILSRYPQHKRVLYFLAKYDNHESLTPAEITELEKFHKLLVK